MEILWWYWVVAGLIMMAGEILLPSFVLLFIGLAAVLVGGLTYALNLSLETEVAIFTVDAILNTWIWFKVIKPKIGDSATSSTLKSIDFSDSAQVIAKPNLSGIGKLRFTTPVQGKDVWDFQCDEPVNVGDQVLPTSVTDNVMNVKKVS